MLCRAIWLVMFMAMATNGWPWPARLFMAMAMATYGGPWPSTASHGLPWPWPALASLAGHGRPWLAKTGQQPSLPASGRHCQPTVVIASQRPFSADWTDWGSRAPKHNLAIAVFSILAFACKGSIESVGSHAGSSHFGPSEPGLASNGGTWPAMASHGRP